jgi:membrane-bound lytic murein transglycosylase F
LSELNGAGMKLQEIMRCGQAAFRTGSEIRQTRKAEPALWAFRYFALLLFLMALPGCDQKPTPPVSHLDRIRASGELRVVTRPEFSAPAEGGPGSVGLEHDLVQLFAARLNVRPRFIVPGSLREVPAILARGEADLAAAGLIADGDRPGVRYGPAYRRITEQVLYSGDSPPPRTLADLGDSLVEVLAGSGHARTLAELQHQYPDLRWRARADQDIRDLLSRTAQGEVAYAVADSDQALLLRRQFPELQIAFDLGHPRHLAWALPAAEDASLYAEVVRFFGDIRQDKTLDQLIDRYYGHAQAFDAVLDDALRQDYRERLPRYRHLFERAGERYGLDWRLLAAIAYQESKWQSRAVSAEGVRGMMMLTGLTARELNVRDRFDAAESIRGGASYFRRMLVELSPEVEDPDRIWFALAAYNLGPGHVEDARELVRRRGGDPNKWIEIKKVLPLLGKPAWYRQTRHGKARGGVAVHYVNSIRRYYDLLVWLSEEENRQRLAWGT